MSHLGKCIAVPDALAGALFESNMMRFRLVSGVLPRYVELYLGGRIGDKDIADYRRIEDVAPDSTTETYVALKLIIGLTIVNIVQPGAGMNVDLELATFDVLHGGDPQAALAAAQAAYRERPTVYAADTLAWAFHRTGDDQSAWHYSREALRLGTQDAMLHVHAAEIATSLGDTAGADWHRAEAARINPYYSPWK